MILAPLYHQLRHGLCRKWESLLGDCLGVKRAVFSGLVEWKGRGSARLSLHCPLPPSKVSHTTTSRDIPHCRNSVSGRCLLLYGARCFHFLISWTNKGDPGSTNALVLEASFSDYEPGELISPYGTKAQELEDLESLSASASIMQYFYNWFFKWNWISDHADWGYYPQTRKMPPSYGSSTSRNTSNSSYASSYGSGSRPASRSSHTRSASVRTAASKNGRPGTSTGVRAEEPVKNGMKPPPAPRPTKKQNSSCLPVQKLRKYYSVNDLAGAAVNADSPPAGREVSICQAFGSLSIDGAASRPSHKQTDQVVSRFHIPSLHLGVSPNVTLRNRGRDVGEKLPVYQKQSGDGPVAPKTPTAKELRQQFARVDSSFKSAKTVYTTPSPTKSSYLTKESNLTGFIAWDVDERLGTFESEFAAMKDMINTSISGQKSLEEDVAAVRQKGT